MSICNFCGQIEIIETFSDYYHLKNNIKASPPNTHTNYMLALNANSIYQLNIMLRLFYKYIIIILFAFYCYKQQFYSFVAVAVQMIVACLA